MSAPEETLCPFCDCFVEEPCTALDEWATCPIGEANTPLDRVELFLAEMEDEDE